MGVDGQGASLVQMLTPVKLHNLGIELIRIVGGKFGNRHENTTGQARPEAGPQGKLQGPVEVNTTHFFNNLCGPHGGEFGGEEFFQPVSGRGKKSLF